MTYAAGRIDKLVDTAKARKEDPAAEAKAFENPIAAPKGWIAAGAFDPAERTRVLDLFGFSGQLVFGTSSLRPALAAQDEGVRHAGEVRRRWPPVRRGRDPTRQQPRAAGCRKPARHPPARPAG